MHLNDDKKALLLTLNKEDERGEGRNQSNWNWIRLETAWKKDRTRNKERKINMTMKDEKEEK